MTSLLILGESAAGEFLSFYNANLFLENRNPEFNTKSQNFQPPAWYFQIGD